MSYFKLKSMTRVIDKEEKQFEREYKLDQLNAQRAKELGISKDKVLVKSINKK